MLDGWYAIRLGSLILTSYPSSVTMLDLALPADNISQTASTFRCLQHACRTKLYRCRPSIRVIHRSVVFCATLQLSADYLLSHIQSCISSPRMELCRATDLLFCPCNPTPAKRFHDLHQSFQIVYPQKMGLQRATAWFRPGFGRSSPLITIIFLRMERLYCLCLLYMVTSTILRYPYSFNTTH